MLIPDGRSAARVAMVHVFLGTLFVCAAAAYEIEYAIGINAAAQGSISGRVTDATTTKATGESGEYAIAGLPSGSYFVKTSSLHYVDDMYDNVSCEPWCTITSGVSVQVDTGRVKGRIN